MWGNCVLLAPQQFLWFADVSAVLTTLTKRLWLWFMAGTYGSETISPREHAGMSRMCDESAQGTGGHVLFGGSKSLCCVLCRVKIHVQLLAAFDGSAGLHGISLMAGAVKEQGFCFCCCTGSFPLHSLNQFYLMQLHSSSCFPLQTRQSHQWLL